MMKQKLALLLTALLLLTGCSSGGSGDTADGQDDGELETIDVVLDWYPNAVHAFLYEAEEKGYFAEEGLQVNILFPSNASDPLTLTAAGETLMARTVDRVTAAEETAMDTLTAAERAQFLALCRRYNAALRQALSTAIEEKKE